MKGSQGIKSSLFLWGKLHSFFYNNLFYKNVEAAIYQNFKNMLRTYPAGWEWENVFILPIWANSLLNEQYKRKLKTAV